jgi:hypothetical protein
VRAVALIVLVPLAAAVGAAAGPAAPSRTVVDRTYVCTNTELTGVRKLTASGRRGYREGRNWKWPGSVDVLNRGGEPVRLPPTATGWRGTSDANWSLSVSAGGGEAGMQIVTRGCTATSVRPALSSRGLSGGEVDYFGDYFECTGVPRRVLVRLRAEFTEATSLRPEPRPPQLRGLRAEGTVAETAVVVQQESGRRLLFGRVLASGKATFFFGRGCVAR